ncbi:MAG: 30S ribosomal protein S6 [Coriobacteriales bacterium]|jgi:small subunit ribosomal protein S6|nr:30S ribosomal protein S6 [Coriobacteriales bacterium]
MKAYELLFFVSPTLEEEAREATLKRVETTITAQDGVVDNVEEWGKRKLAFEVDKLSEGDYILVDFHTDPTTIAEIDRVLRITDAVKRYMIVARKDRDLAAASA